MPSVRADIALSEALNQHRLSQFHQGLSPHQQHLLQQCLACLDGHNYLQELGCPSAPQGFHNDLSTDEAELIGAYAMGSSGNLGQTPESDVDIWVVHHGELNQDQRNQLQRRLEWLANWLNENGLEASLFAIDPNQFGRPTEASLDRDHSGSAQHWLLLEEFYRTHIRLMGKPIAWWPGAPKHRHELLNLGDIQHLPASEYFGAGLWQLFKGVDRPHKSVLKVLLLEAYVADYPDQRILRDQLWFQMKSGKPFSELDPYLMLYLRIEDYLKRQHSPSRLSLVQRCFYLKCAPKLTSAQQDGWKQQTMRQLVERWQWTPLLLESLDQAQQWHAGQVHWFHHQLSEMMLTSYQRLANFANQQRLPRKLKIQDLSLLTRKLYTEYETHTNKLMPLNPLWSSKLQEPDLTLVQVESRHGASDLWYLYRQPADKRLLFGESPLFHHQSRLACVAWAAQNHIIDRHTRIHCFTQGQGHFSKRLTELGHTLASRLSNQESPNLSQLQQPWHFNQLTLVVNLEQDGTEGWNGSEGLLDMQPDRVLSSGRPGRFLLGSLELLTRNSWGELQYHYFDSEQGLLNLLRQVLGGVDIDHPPQIAVLCVGKKGNRAISDRLTFLLQQCYRLKQQSRMDQVQVLPITLGATRYGLSFTLSGFDWSPIKQMPDLPKVIQDGLVHTLPHPGCGEDPYSCAPALLRNHSRLGMRQYFVRERNGEVDLYLLDEENQMHRQCLSRQQLHAQINAASHIDEVPYQSHRQQGRFNLPQFYRLDRHQGQLVVKPLSEGELTTVGKSS